MGREMAVLTAALVLAIHALPAAAVGEPSAPGAARDPGKAQATSRSPFGGLSTRNRNEPIAVRSDKLEFSYRERLLTYTGQVVVTQGDLTLKADVLKVTITDDPQRQQLEQIVAIGGVEIAQGPRTASGGKAVFDQRQRTIELSENAVLTEGPNKISGDRVIVYLDEERSVVEGGDRRVQALLFPGDNLGALGQSKEAPQP